MTSPSQHEISLLLIFLLELAHQGSNRSTRSSRSKPPPFDTLRAGSLSSPATRGRIQEGFERFELFERLEQFERALFRLVRPSPIGDLRPVRPLLMRVAQIFDDLVLHLLL